MSCLVHLSAHNGELGFGGSAAGGACGSDSYSCIDWGSGLHR